MRLIDADELLDFINSMHFDDYNLYSEIFDYIDDMPTIDEQPVTHGEWIPSKMNEENKENAEMLGIDIETFLSKAAYCSYCGRQQITNGRDKTRKALIHKAIYRYCPNCGAKMDGGKSDG